MSPEELSAIHHECFVQPRPWTPDEFKILLKKNILLWKSRAFLLGRQVNGEAEILTLAVAPNERRNGLASSLIREFVNKMKQVKVKKIILEVDHRNKPALSLYKNFSFKKIGERKAYYKHNSEDPSSNAFLLECKISYDN
tara:strand:- start:565 stop:984 length:420 start_codon:yes stop_codon:yes gene_type:complete